MKAVRRLALVVALAGLGLPAAGAVVAASGDPVARLALPLSGPGGLARYEGRQVHLEGPLTVQQHRGSGCAGSLVLAAGPRLEAPTNRFRPGASARALAAANRARSVEVEAAPGAAWRVDAPPVRAGDTVEAIEGLVVRGPEGGWRIRPTVPPRFERPRPRPARPPEVGGQARIASANLQNWFTTLDDGHHACAPSGTPRDCRGARTEAELARQRGKLVAELSALDADVLGLMEVQNDGAAALQDLVDALNRHQGALAYLRVPDPPTAGATGHDAIEVALVYRRDRVRPVGPARSDPDPAHSRLPLAQTFEWPDGSRVNVVVSHFKSKRCDDAQRMDAADRDAGDLQGCWNGRRVRQARALRSFVDSVRSASGVAATLLIGDFNAYAREDPVEELTRHGYVDLVGRFSAPPDFGYSYVYDAAAGRLDQAFADPTLAPRITGAAEWHVNADEPPLPRLDSHPAACPGPDRSAGPYRASDHDPLVVGLRLKN